MKYIPGLLCFQLTVAVVSDSVLVAMMNGASVVPLCLAMRQILAPDFPQARQDVVPMSCSCSTSSFESVLGANVNENADAAIVEGRLVS